MNVLSIRSYLSNPKLKRIGQSISMTREQVDQYILCSEDPIYFAENFYKLVHVDKGLITPQLYPYQKNLIMSYHNDRKVVINACRQSGKTSATVAYLLWFILFNKDKTVGILANKEKTAREILSRIKLAYEQLPLWIQQGVRIWNKGDIEVENGCKILASSTSSSAIRGFSLSMLYIDEYGFVPANIADEFFSSVYPTISGGTTTKLLVSSTPNGMNHFYKMVVDAREKRNGFTLIEVDWRAVPGRDDAWALDQKNTLGEEKFLQEMEIEFMGSNGTLINGRVLRSMAFISPLPIKSIEGLSLYKEPSKERSYMIVVDTSRGKGLDYHAFIVVDISEVPYRIVCTFRDNELSPVTYPSVIHRIAKAYNDAYVLVEINDNGQQIADGLYFDFEYENVLSTTAADKGKKVSLSWSISGKGVDRGIRTTKSIKRLGCSLLKNMIENHNLIIEDFHIIKELSTFIAKSNSYEADDGSNDDMVICLVLFAWATSQVVFEDLSNMNIKDKLYRQQLDKLEEEMLPLPMSSEDFIENRIVEDGSVWISST